MSPQTKPSIVFCHGIWADGSCFNKLAAPLQAEGYEVVSGPVRAQLQRRRRCTRRCATSGKSNNPIILGRPPYGGAADHLPPPAPMTARRRTGLTSRPICGPIRDRDLCRASRNKFPVTPAFTQAVVADGRVWMKPSAIGCFCGDLPEEEQKVVWATGQPPGGDLVRPKRPGRGLEDQAVLVHRGQQRPGRPPGTPRARPRPSGWAPPPTIHRQQPRPHAVAPRLRPRRHPCRRGRRLSRAFLSPCSSTGRAGSQKRRP